MATFTTAAAAAALASWRPAAFIARSPTASPSLWTPLRSPSPAVGLRRADASPCLGSTLLVSPSRTPFDGGSGTSSRHGRSLSPEEHRHRGRHESHTSPRASRSAARVEVSGCKIYRGCSIPHLTYPLDERLTLSGLGYDYAIGEEDARTSASLHYNGNMKPWLELGIPDYRKYWKRFLTRDEQFMDECNVLGIWRTAQKKVAHMINQVLSVRRKFEQFEISLVPRSQVSYVQKLARDSIDAQIAKSLSVNAIKERRETCTICLEDTDISKIHSVEGCMHRFCFSCMREHVKVKLLHGMLPVCPLWGWRKSSVGESNDVVVSSKNQSLCDIHYMTKIFGYTIYET